MLTLFTTKERGEEERRSEEIRSLFIKRSALQQLVKELARYPRNILKNYVNNISIVSNISHKGKRIGGFALQKTGKIAIGITDLFA